MDKITEQMMKQREPVHEMCLGHGFGDWAKHLVAEHCSRIEPIETFGECAFGEDEEMDKMCRCTAYVKPSRWWRNGFYCPLATHYKPELAQKKAKVRVGQQKQKKI